MITKVKGFDKDATHGFALIYKVDLSESNYGYAVVSYKDDREIGRQGGLGLNEHGNTLKNNMKDIGVNEKDIDGRFVSIMKVKINESNKQIFQEIKRFLKSSSKTKKKRKPIEQSKKSIKNGKDLKSLI